MHIFEHIGPGYIFSYVEGCDVSLQPTLLLDDNITKV